MKRGRLCPAVNFGTGRRGRIPSSATAQQLVETIDQMRRPQRKPTLSSSAFSANGKMKPRELMRFFRLARNQDEPTADTSSGKDYSSR